MMVRSAQGKKERMGDNRSEEYRRMRDDRRELVQLAVGELIWLAADDEDVVSFRSGGVTVVANTGPGAAPRPAGEVLLASGPLGDGLVPGDTTVWILTGS